MGTLPSRRETILKIIVKEYIASGIPVASETLAEGYPLKISPATIRNEMARLEEEGYITRPHTSAGRIPSDKGYRYYVENLFEEVEIPDEEREYIGKLFHQVQQEISQWLKLAVELLAWKLKNIALATLPWTTEYHFKHLHLVEIQEFIALLILVLQEARIKQQPLTLEQKVSQDELNAVANKLNAAYEGLTSSQIRGKRLKLSLLEKKVSDAILELIEAENRQEFEEVYLNGLGHLLSQPEFAHSKKMFRLIEMLGKKSLPKSILAPKGQGVQVIIGSENEEEVLQECSLVMGSYGIPEKTAGSIGIIGPTRMPYHKVIPTVSYLSSVMSQMMSELYV